MPLMEPKDRELLFISEIARMHWHSVDAVRDDIRRGLGIWRHRRAKRGDGGGGGS